MDMILCIVESFTVHFKMGRTVIFHINYYFIQESKGSFLVKNEK